MRALAAGTVFLSHVAFFGFFADPAAQRTAKKVLGFGMNGFIGVSFFFILSGFVLTWVARDSDTFGQFWRRRAFKIYPNHLLTLVVAVLLFVFVVGREVNPLGAVLNMLLLHAWAPQVEVSYNLNVVAWTLSCEFLFYALFPFILPLIKRVRDDRLWYCFGGLVALIWIIPAVAAIPEPGPTSFPGLPPDFQFWAIYILPASRLPEFVMGMVLARIIASGRRVPVGIGGGLALTLLAGFLSTFLPLTYQLVAVWVVPLAFTVAAGATADVEGRRTFLSTRLMVWLGEISFAFYLWHFLLLAAGRGAVGAPDGLSTPVALGLIAALFAVIILVSWATFVWFERPIMRRFAVPKRRRPAPPPGSPGGAPSSDQAAVPAQRGAVQEPASSSGSVVR